MLRRLLPIVIGVLVCCGGVQVTWAQSPIEMRVEEMPLARALSQLRAQTGLDLIYAERLVQDRRVSCTYTGADPKAALDCLLNGTSLRAERVRRRQYVLVAASDEAESRPIRVERGPLRGHVVDEETGERLPGAHVYLTDLKAGTITNSDGYFVLSSLPAGPYDVRISYLGYQSIDTTLVAGGPGTRIALTPSAIESEEVLVEAGSTSAEEASSLPGMMAVPLEQLNRLPSLGEPDLFRALQWTPGVRKAGLIGGGLSVRGASSDQNLYLLDGAPIYHPWHAFSLISTFQAETLSNTTLYRGAFPAEHGGRLSSVLDAQMKTGSRNEPSATAALSVLSGRFRIETPVTESTSFMLAGRRSYVDKLLGRRHPVTDASGRRDTLRTGYYFYDTSAKISHRIDEGHRVSLSYYHGRDDLDLRLPFDLSLDFESWLQPSDLFFEIQQNWDNRLVSAQHQYLMGDDLFLNSTAYYSGYRAQEASFVQPTTTASLASDYRVRLHDAGLKVKAEYHPSVAHEITGGLDLKTLQFESALNSRLRRSSSTVDERVQESDLSAVQVAAYLQDDWRPTPEWTVQPGVRVSYFSGGDYMHVAPRLSARYMVHPRWLVLRGSAGLHVQYLHRLRDRYSLAYDLVSSRWVPASNRVQPATGLQVGWGARSQPLPSLTMEVNTYFRGVRDMLVPVDAFQQKDDIQGPGIEVGALLGQYTTGEERAFGVELSTVWNPGAWSLRLGARSGRTFVRAPSQNGGQQWRPTDFDVPYSLQAAVRWEGAAWSATVATKARSGYPITAPVARYQIGDPVEEGETSYLYRPRVNNDRLPSYVRLDLTLGYDFQLLSADWTAKLNLYNTTNRDNVVSRTYRPTDTGVRVDEQQGFPILPLLELEMRL